jgi:hypothetical protein
MVTELGSHLISVDDVVGAMLYQSVLLIVFFSCRANLREVIFSCILNFIAEGGPIVVHNATVRKGLRKGD